MPTLRTVLASILLGSTLWLPQAALASVFNGGGLQGGIGIAGQIEGPLDSSGSGPDAIRNPIVSLLNTVLSFLALAAVITIIIAGLYLIFSNGNEDAKGKAKTIILYTIIGLLIIFFARLIVGLFNNGTIFGVS